MAMCFGVVVPVFLVALSRVVLHVVAVSRTVAVWCAVVVWHAVVVWRAVAVWHAVLRFGPLLYY
jgi:hypothetical protein